MDRNPARGAIAGSAWQLFLLAGIGLAVLIAILPAGPGPEALGAAGNAAAALAVGVGIRRNGPSVLNAWRLIFAGVAVAFGLNLSLAIGSTWPAVALPHALVEGAFVVPYALLAAGLWWLARSRDGIRGGAALLDATIIVVGLGLGAFLFALSLAGAESPGLEDPRVLASFFIGVPALAMVVRLALTPGPGRGTVGLLVAAATAQSAGDATFGLAIQVPTLPVAPEPLWLLSLVCFGAAGLHPSNAQAADRSLLGPGPRFALLAAALMAPSLAALTRHLFPGAERTASLDLVAAAVVVLAIARIRSLFRALELGRREEATARAFAEELVATSPGVVVRGRVSDDVLTYASPGLWSVLGYRPEDAVGRPGWWPGIIHPDDVGRFPTPVAEAAAMGGTVTGEVRMRHADGSYRNVLVASRWEHSDDGNPTAFLGTGVDVTAWRAAQTELTAASGHLEEIARSTPVILLRGRGPELVLDYISPSVESILGYPPAAVIGVPRWVVDILEPSEREATLAAFMASVSARETRFMRELRFVTIAGDVRDMHVTLRRTFNHDGSWQFSGTLVDVTERNETERRLREAIVEADRANRAKSEFLSGVSHELRTPLNAVLGFGQLLERAELPDPEDRDAVAQVLRGGRRLLEMVDGLIELARVDAGRLTLSIEPIDVDEVLRDAVDLIRPAADAQGLTVRLPAADPAAWVLADGRRLRQVLLNLLSNAVKHSPPGAEIVIARTPGVASGRWRISVSDSGPGIAPEVRERLFTPFRRDASAGDGGPGGLGVGLALAAGLIEAMAGTIEVDSIPGRGSAFHVELPATEPPAEPREPGEAGARPAGGEAPARTIVYIEDNLPNLGLVERILTARPGTRLVAAMQGRLGLELVRQHETDLVLLDLHLPDISGEEVLEALRGDDRTRDIPVLVLSSSNEPGLRRRLEHAGSDAFLAKPLDMDAFLADVDRLVEGRRTRVDA